jgi:FkbM family methyltransferase
MNLLIPPGVYDVTFEKGDQTTTTSVTVNDQVALITSQTWKDGKPFYFRDLNWDRYIIKENSYGDLKIVPGDVALDIGGHIGTFSRLALYKGASVVAIEPDVYNNRILTMNVAEYPGKYEVIRAAVVADGSDFAAAGVASLWVDADGGGDSSRTALHSLYRTRGSRLPVEVPTVTWSDALKSCSPTILKVDVEGAELTYDWSMLSVCTELRAVAVEIEKKGGAPGQRESIGDNLSALGFKCFKETSGWSIVQMWSR